MSQIWKKMQTEKHWVLQTFLLMQLAYLLFTFLQSGPKTARTFSVLLVLSDILHHETVRKVAWGFKQRVRCVRNELQAQYTACRPHCKSFFFSLRCWQLRWSCRPHTSITTFSITGFIIINALKQSGDTSLTHNIYSETHYDLHVVGLSVAVCSKVELLISRCSAANCLTRGWNSI